jgi:catechol-2,3-dioxygenase
MPTISCLGHAGLFVNDLDASVAFYRDLLGLTVTDDDRDHGLVFMSADPNEEHHHVVLCSGRTAGPSERWLQQLSFRCESLEDVIAFHKRFIEAGVQIQYSVTHGNAVGVYFFDPDGNRCEVYWRTAMPARQAFRVSIDLDRDPEEILAEVRQLVEAHGSSGYVEDDNRQSSADNAQ